MSAFDLSMQLPSLLGRAARPAGGAPLNVFCSGVGGTGLSGLARLLHALGHRVRGSDRSATERTRGLRRDGIEVAVTQTAENLTPDTDLFVATAALPPDHPELSEAIRVGIPCVKYAEALAALVAARRGVAISGTHGKTTTTGLTAFVLRAAQRDPSFVVGGDPHDLPHAQIGRGSEFVFEACEFDRSFRHYVPSLAVILNVEEDHLDCYEGLEDICGAFEAFGATIQENGVLLANADCPNTTRVAERVARQRPDVRVLQFGFAEGAQVRAVEVGMVAGLPRFQLEVEGVRRGEVRLGIPGLHNVSNALAAIAVAIAVGVDPREAAQACEAYRGVRRRFDLLRGGDPQQEDVVVVDDYAHHPTAIRAVLAAARERFPGRRQVVVFEPHQASRTRQFFDGFVEALSTTDKLILADIYACRDQESDLRAVSSEALAEAIQGESPGCEAEVGGSGEALRARVLEEVGPGDVVLCLGAGRISDVAQEVAERLPLSPRFPICQTTEPGSPQSGRFLRLNKTLEQVLAERLGGRLKVSESLDQYCTLKVGGRARFFVAPETEDEAIFVARTFHKYGIPFFPLGWGSNVVFAGDEYDGAVLLTRGLRQVRALGQTLRASAGAALPGAIRLAERQGLAGLAEFAGIPGTLGGAVFGNAGGPPGTPTVADRALRVRVLERDGRVRWRSAGDLGLRYRHSDLDGALVLAVDLGLEPGDPEQLKRVRVETQQRKAQAQPLDARSAGCTFRNPHGESAGRLIDRLGLKGLSVGDAVVSTHHGNFIVNEGSARPQDVVALVELVRARVREDCGVELQTEVRFVL